MYSSLMGARWCLSYYFSLSFYDPDGDVAQFEPLEEVCPALHAVNRNKGKLH